MKLDRKYAEFASEKAIELLKIDSPTGYTAEAAKWVKAAFEEQGLGCRITNKGAVLIDFHGSESEEGGVLFEAHADTLGAMVSEIKSSGRLKVTNIGGLVAGNVETEDVRIRTRDGKVYEGAFQLENASSHVNKELSSTVRDFDNVEVVIDAKADSVEDVKALGISVGDFVCVNPRAHITETGYIKSRFLDDKLSVGILLGLAKYLKDNQLVLNRPVYAMVTVYEEVGHGGSTSIPEGITEAISVDMGCVGKGLTCTERQVSICAKDSGGPYDYEITGKLVQAAISEEADYAIDVYPFYGSDVEATLRAGYDVRHGLIGAGVYASHGYERSHVDGVYATLKVLKGYLGV